MENLDYFITNKIGSRTLPYVGVNGYIKFLNIDTFNGPIINPTPNVLTKYWLLTDNFNKLFILC